MRDSKLYFLEEPTCTLHQAHPLTAYFCEAVEAARRKPRRPPRHLSAPLAAEAERWVQFVSAEGHIFFHDFDSHQTVMSFEEILGRLPREEGLEEIEQKPVEEEEGRLKSSVKRKTKFSDAVSMIRQAGMVAIEYREKQETERQSECESEHES